MHRCYYPIIVVMSTIAVVCIAGDHQTTNAQQTTPLPPPPPVVNVQEVVDGDAFTETRNRHASKTGRLSPSHSAVSPTKSSTRTPPPIPTGTQTRSRPHNTSTMHITLTKSMNATASQAGLTPSSTQPPTHTHGLTLSRSVSSSATRSVTRSMAPLPTDSMSSSDQITATPSHPPTTTNNITPSHTLHVSGSASTSDEVTASHSLLATRTRTATPTNASTMTPSHITTPSTTVSYYTTTATYSTTTSNQTNLFTPSLTNHTTSDSQFAQHTSTITDVIPRTVVTAVEQLIMGIAATTPVLQYSVGAVSTSARSISRMGAVSKVGSCQSPFSPPQGLLSSRIGGCGTLTASSSSIAEYARGDAVLGVTSLLCATALLAACCFLYSLALHMPLRDGAAALSMPSLLLPLWGAAVPTGVGGMVALGRNWEGCVGDGVLLLFGVAVVVVLPMALLTVGTTLMLQRLQVTRKVAPATVVKDAVRCAHLQLVARVALERMWTWHPKTGEESRLHLYGRVLVLQQRVLWYATLDAAVLVAVSALAATAVDLPFGTCRALGGGIVALLALQLVVCGVARPFTTLLDHVVAMATLALNVVGAALQVSLLNGRSDRMLTAAADLDLLLLGVSGLKAALDVIDLVAAIRRRCGLHTTEGRMQMEKRRTRTEVLEGFEADVDVFDAELVLDARTPQPLLDMELDFDDDVVESVPGLLGIGDEGVSTMSAAEEGDTTALALAYAEMSEELPSYDEDLL